MGYERSHHLEGYRQKVLVLTNYNFGGSQWDRSAHRSSVGLKNSLDSTFASIIEVFRTCHVPLKKPQ